MKLRRIISVSGSVLLTLLLIAFAIGLVGYAYFNQQLKSVGVTDWEIEFEQITPSHIIIRRLEVTINSLPQSSTQKSPTALDLTEIFSTQIPTIVPERIDIRSLQLKGTLLPSNVSATLKLLNQQQLRLQVDSRQPVEASFNILRSDGYIELQASYDSAALQANYNYRSGQLKADVSYLLAAQEFADKVSLEQLPLNVKWKGKLPPQLESASLESLISELSGEILLSVKRPATITVMDSQTIITGQLKLDLNNGIINSYRLELDGETENLTSLTEAELPIQLASLSWELNSSEDLTLPLLNAQQAINRTHWPIRFSADAKGRKDETIKISSELSVQQEDWQFRSLELAHVQFQANDIELLIAEQSLTINKLTSSFSGKLSTSAAEFESIEPTHIGLNILNNDVSAVVDLSHVHYPYSDPQSTVAEFDLTIHADAINFDPLQNLKASFSSEFHYQQQQLSSDGALLLGDHVRMEHHSQINSTKLKSQVKLDEFDWQQAPQLNTLLSRLAPQLVVSKANISGQTGVTFFWDDGRWRLDNGRLKLQQSDWVADTLSVVDSNLDFEFSADNELLDVDNAQLHIGSVQQGFALGPITAEFGLQLPFEYPMQSTLNLTSHTIKGLGGNISAPNQKYSLTDSFSLPIVFEKISLGELMRQYPSDKISIDGEISGTIPLHWNSNQLTVNRGYVDALSPGGHLQVDSSALVAAAGSNPSLQTLAGVLSNFFYEQLSAVIDYDQDGKLMLAIQLKGSNPELENGRPVELNLKLEEDLPALIKGLQLSNSLNEVIRKRVQQKIN